ncbi:CNDP dipeptidase [Ramicandelaber brevisporus]|nr:CNDP dipeptidase [Ramicandelaber brevisporus]
MTIDNYFAHIEANQSKYIDRLREIVAIPSVSGDVAHRAQVVKMGEWLLDELKRLGATTKRVEPGKQELEGQTIDLPPVVLATYGTDPTKKTVLIYGHYDVQPALKEDGWNTDPWTLTEDKEGRLYGRGATDDKGPVLGWLCAIEAHQELGLDLPVNLKFCFEGMEESGSEGLNEVIIAEADKYFAGVDCVCISDNYWLGKSKPCLTYGLRGVSYFQIQVSGPKADLHSGVFGGTIHEPMTDLVALMGRLVTPKGEILVPGIMDQVAPLTEEEKKTYNGLDFSMQDFKHSSGSNGPIFDNETDTLMHRWRYPSLSLHGIEGAFYSSGAKTVIPAKVSGKFSIRTVPNMQLAEVTKLVIKHVEAEFAKLGSPNKMRVECLHDGIWWVSSPNHWNFVAGANAVEKVFQTKPDLTREGGSIPVTLTFQDALKRNVLLLPMGSSDDGAHSINEKVDRFNYIQGIKLYGAYLHEIATIDTSSEH